MAQGLLGQYIYVNPVHDIVIVRLGRRVGKNVSWAQLFRSLAKTYGER
jgi:CubicO group peptidase (beta-lactamase class C family)